MKVFSSFTALIDVITASKRVFYNVAGKTVPKMNVDNS